MKVYHILSAILLLLNIFMNENDIVTFNSWNLQISGIIKNTVYCISFTVYSF